MRLWDGDGSSGIRGLFICTTYLVVFVCLVSTLYMVESVIFPVELLYIVERVHRITIYSRTCSPNYYTIQSSDRDGLSGTCGLFICTTCLVVFVYLVSNPSMVEHRPTPRSRWFEWYTWFIYLYDLFGGVCLLSQQATYGRTSTNTPIEPIRVDSSDIHRLFVCTTCLMVFA
jgi:hypothetical protein